MAKETPQGRAQFWKWHRRFRTWKAGIRVAIGSDEAGINDDKDLLQEMRLVLKLHRVPGVEHIPPTAYQVFQIATQTRPIVAL